MYSVHAHAQASSPDEPRAAEASTPLDEVTLRDGTLLRGHVTERRADGGVVFVLLDGTRRALRAEELVSTRGPGFATPSEGSAAGPPAPAPARDASNSAVGNDHGDGEPYGPAPGRRPLRLRSLGAPLRVAVVEQRTERFAPRFESETLRTRTVCATPCTLYTEARTLALQLSGEGVATYQAELLVPNAYALRTPRASFNSAGAGLLLAGGVSLLVGVALLSSDAAAGRAASPVGITLAALGVASAGTGAVFLGVNRSGAVLEDPPASP